MLKPRDVVRYTLIVSVVLALVASIWPGIRAYKDKQNELACQRNLKQLSLGFSSYLAEHGQFPDKLSQLYPKYVSDLNVFVCPGRPVQLQTAADIDSQSGYVLLAPSAKASDGNTPVLSDRVRNHPKRGTSEIHGGFVLHSGCWYVWTNAKQAKDNPTGFLFPD